MFVKLCEENLLISGELRSFKIKGNELLAVYIDGEIFCLDGRCSHAGAPLAEGTVESGILTCPWHYSQFDLASGVVLRGPAAKPLKRYVVEKRDKMIFVDL